MLKRIYKTFIASTSEISGNLGWLIKDAPDNYYPCESGLLMAHDLLEHKSNLTGSIEDELMAFGAAYYIRYETEYFAHKIYNTFETIFDNDIAYIIENNFRYILDNKLVNFKFDKNNQHIIKSFIAVIDNANKRIEHYYNKFNTLPKIYYNFFTYWMYKGYKWAQKRYLNNYNICDLFTQIESKFFNPEYEGQVLKVKIDILNHEVILEDNYEHSY